MGKWFPSWQEAMWWVHGGITYAWVTFFFMAIFDPTREWLAHVGPFSDYYNEILLLSPITWGWNLAYLVLPNNYRYFDLIAILLGTISAAALGYALKTAVRTIFRR